MANVYSLKIETDEEQIRGLIEERIQAFRDRNIDVLLSRYLPGVTTFNLAPPLRTLGVDREGSEAWLKSYQTPIICEIKDLSIFSSGDVGFCHSLNRFTGTMNNGKEEDMWLRATLGLRKIENKWMIAHEHMSEPFDMSTFKALLDLKP
jgi:ketosteroid isomerase-like protein